MIVPRSLARRARITAIQASLPADEIWIEDGIPVTSPPRTIFDLAGVLPRPHLEQAMERVEALRLWDALTVGELLERYPGRRGARKLRAILAAAQLGRGITREELEALFRAFLSELTLPTPEINAPLTPRSDSFVPDFLWRDQRVIVELDGFETHGTKQAIRARSPPRPPAPGGGLADNPRHLATSPRGAGRARRRSRAAAAHQRASCHSMTP